MRRYDFPAAPSSSDDPGTAGGAELPPGHDDFRRGLDRFLHVAAVGYHPALASLSLVRPSSLRARGFGEAPTRAGRCVRRRGCKWHCAAAAPILTGGVNRRSSCPMWAHKEFFSR